MPVYRVEFSELRKADGEKVAELTDYLQEKLDLKPKTVGGAIILEIGDEVTIKRRLVRDILKRFMYKHDLRQKYRVLGNGENYTIKKIK